MTEGKARYPENAAVAGKLVVDQSESLLSDCRFSLPASGVIVGMFWQVVKGKVPQLLGKERTEGSGEN
jgi:hypothetical protein